MREVSVVTGIAALVVVGNMLLDGYVGLDGARHAGLLADLHLKLSLPMTPFTLASPSLGLLLGKFIRWRVGSALIWYRHDAVIVSHNSV